MSDVIQRGSTVFFSFTFQDENGDEAQADSAALELTYPGRDGFVTETLTLTLAGGSWQAEWESTKSRGGWVHYHAHAIADDNLTRDGRFKLAANRASYQHDVLPSGGRLNDPASTLDYGQ